MDKVELHKDIVTNMNEMYKSKNEDYGDSFDKSLDKFGLLSSLIRLTDKMNRFEQLIDNDSKVNDESIEDTLLDMANYAIMTVMWKRLEEEKEKEKMCKDGVMIDNININNDLLYPTPSWMRLVDNWYYDKDRDISRNNILNKELRGE